MDFLKTCSLTKKIDNFSQMCELRELTTSPKWLDQLCWIFLVNCIFTKNCRKKNYDFSWYLAVATKNYNKKWFDAWILWPRITGSIKQFLHDIWLWQNSTILSWFGNILILIDNKLEMISPPFFQTGFLLPESSRWAV